ncbi:MAG: glucosaminidase domain-containing protein [Bacteroidales bacterium]|nr:glucosaminidase domain-containing protein [Bacteroidales bacterium]
MHKPVFFSLWFVLLHALVLSGQTNHEAQQAYIEAYRDIAVEEMNQFKIPASVKLAQGILETNSGRSRLAVKANNHFGIKCHTGWQGKTIRKTDDAYKECFRKYDDPAFSFVTIPCFLRGALDMRGCFNWISEIIKAGAADSERRDMLPIRVMLSC